MQDVFCHLARVAVVWSPWFSLQVSLQAFEAGGWPALPAAGIGALTWAGSNVGDEHNVLVGAHLEGC